MKLPQNKAARLAINVGFVAVWLELTKLTFGLEAGLFAKIYEELIYLISPPFLDGIASRGLPRFIWFLVQIIPMFLATRYIWWGRIRPRPRITGSREQERAGKKWDAVVDELKNRK